MAFVSGVSEKQAARVDYQSYFVDNRGTDIICDVVEDMRLNAVCVRSFIYCLQCDARLNY